MKSNETFKVAVHGTLLAGERNEGYADGAISRVPCVIRGELYDTGWGFPAFVPGDNGTVKAELVEIPRADWPAMDRLEGYPRLYNRKLIPATLEDGSTVTAWVYVMNNLPQQAEIIAGGDWKNRNH